MSNHNILPWIADAIDNITLPHAEILRIKSLMDELCISLDRVARQSEVPLTPAINDLIRDLKHSSTYINGTPAQQYVVGSGKGGTPIITPTAPSHMDSAFSGQKAMKIENLYAHQPGNMHGYVDPLQALSKVNSVDLIKKTDFDPKGEEPRPTPGEVEAFVNQQETRPETGEEIYTSLDELKMVFAIEPAESYTYSPWKVRVFDTEVKYAFTPKMDYPVAIPQEDTEPTTVTWFGYDTEEKELVIVGLNDNAYRLTRLELKDFILYSTPHYDGRVINRIAKRIKSELADLPVNTTVQVDALDVGAGVIFVKFQTPAGVDYAFSTTRTVFDKYFNAA